MANTRDSSAEDDLFPTGLSAIPEAHGTGTVPLAADDVLPLHIGAVRKSIAGTSLRMLAYNGSIPGPLLRVRQGTIATVEVINDAGLEQTVHWHGLRLDNRFDGVPYETQQPIATGGQFRCELQFPDPGLYWYHPHIREDYAQEMGLYGQIIVDPASPDYWAPVNRDIALTLDDLLLVDGRFPTFHRSGPTHTMMGRSGTVLLVNGETEAAFAVSGGEVVRLYLTNTANTRVFNVALTGATMKLVGGDSGRYEREMFVESVLLSPSERAIVDVLFERSGTAVLEHRTPDASSALVTFSVADGYLGSSFRDTFHVLRTDPDLDSERAGLSAHLQRTPDKTLHFLGEMDMNAMEMDAVDVGGMGVRSAGMSGGHPGDAEALQDWDGQHPDHLSNPVGLHDHEPHGAHSMHQTTDDDGIEWEDTMPQMNALSNLSNMTWKIVDTATGAANEEISWRLHVGDRLKVRLDNSFGSDHQMHHPFHLHGAGRFLVLDRGGVPESNLVWKDTVLVRAGEVVHILFDVTNPGRWMAHCHIAEHIESGMMFSFDVLEPTAAER